MRNCIQYMPNETEFARLAFITNGSITKVQNILNALYPDADLSYQNIYYWYQRSRFLNITNAALWYKNQLAKQRVLVHKTTQALNCIAKIKDENLRKAGFESISSHICDIAYKI